MKRIVNASGKLIAAKRACGVMALCAMGATALPAQPTLTRFEAPGAEGTFLVSINKAGTIAGSDADASGVYHGFVRAASGTITTFDAPGASTVQGAGTFAFCINTDGAIAGYYVDASFVDHSFVRSASGTISGFGSNSAASS